METPAPIFVLSCERSGSTLLQFILDTHPDLSAPGELALGVLIGNLRTTVSRSFGTKIAGAPGAREEAERREVRDLVAGLLGRFTQGQGKKAWCDKTPSNLRYLPQLEWAFPEARYVCLHRNALDVVHSCLELPEREFLWWSLSYVVKHHRNLPAAFLDNWADRTQEMLALESRHPRTCRIRYEDLVADPVAALTPVFRFLGLEWDPSMLERVFTIPRDPTMGGDYKIFTTHRIEKDRVGKGSAREADLLSRVPADLRDRQRELHRRLGYETKVGTEALG